MIVLARLMNFLLAKKCLKLVIIKNKNMFTLSGFVGFPELLSFVVDDIIVQMHQFKKTMKKGKCVKKKLKE